MSWGQPFGDDELDEIDEEAQAGQPTPAPIVRRLVREVRRWYSEVERLRAELEQMRAER